MITKIKNLILFLYLKIFGAEKYARLLGVKIGEKCRIYNTDWGSEPFLIDIGSNVTISKNVTFITHDGSPWIFREKTGRYYKYARITIEDNIFIGMNTIIMPGVTIKSNVIVGSGSIVTKNLDSSYVYAGNPARKIDTLENYLAKVKSDFIYSSNSKNKKSDIVLIEKQYFLKKRK
ncbi:acyltransferase [Providencia rettgeri]|nr:acyltransferase [Providencia rettgeri]MDK3009195.1 acyltransferase [Providencia rettgeri]